MNGETKKCNVSIGQFVEAREAEVTSPFNVWCTGERVKAPPKYDEEERHYALHGGPKRLGEHLHVDLSIPSRSPRIGRIIELMRKQK